jgi:hypothetical protein
LWRKLEGNKHLRMQRKAIGWKQAGCRRHTTYPLPVLERRTNDNERQWGWLPSNKERNKLWKACLRMWDFKFSRRRVCCSESSSGMYCRVKWLSTIILHGSISKKITLNTGLISFTSAKTT